MQTENLLISTSGLYYSGILSLRVEKSNPVLYSTEFLFHNIYNFVNTSLEYEIQ